MSIDFDSFSHTALLPTFLAMGLPGTVVFDITDSRTVSHATCVEFLNGLRTLNIVSPLSRLDLKHNRLQPIDSSVRDVIQFRKINLNTLLGLDKSEINMKLSIYSLEFIAHLI